MTFMVLKLFDWLISPSTCLYKGAYKKKSVIHTHNIKYNWNLMKTAIYTMYKPDDITSLGVSGIITYVMHACFMPT